MSYHYQLTWFSLLWERLFFICYPRFTSLVIRVNQLFYEITAPLVCNLQTYLKDTRQALPEMTTCPKWQLTCWTQIYIYNCRANWEPNNVAFHIVWGFLHKWVLSRCTGSQENNHCSVFCRSRWLAVVYCLVLCSGSCEQVNEDRTHKWYSSNIGQQRRAAKFNWRAIIFYVKCWYRGS